MGQPRRTTPLTLLAADAADSLRPRVVVSLRRGRSGQASRVPWRRMSTRDDDILDFDFFDEEDAPSWEEPEGLETPPSSPERGRRGRGSGLRPPRNLTPLLRLIGLIALAILVIVLLVVWVEGCTASAQRDRNSTYLADIGSIGNASAKLGQQVSHAPDDARAERGGPRREARRLRPDGRQPDAAGRRT